MHILWVKTELLHPVDKGGRIRSYHILRELKARHRITYAALDAGASAEEIELSSEYCHELVRVPFSTVAKTSPAFYADVGKSLASTLPYAVWKYRSAELSRAIDAVARAAQVDLVVCDFLATAPCIPDGLPCPVVLFEHNVEAAIWRRHAEVATNPLKKLLLRDQHRRMVSYEAEACNRFEHVIAVSEKDAGQIMREYRAGSVSHVPTGVDVDFFRPSGRVARGPERIVFTGSMDWLPNEDGVLWFVRDVLPLVRREVPGVEVAIVGRAPTAAMRALAERDKALIVTGRVDDVREEIERASVFIVPLRIGGGTRLKIYEAMAMEKPVVSTAVGAEGLAVTDGADIVLADGPEAFAGAVVRLIKNPREAEVIGQRAARSVREGFGWKRAAACFSDICESVVGERRRRRRASGGAA